MSTRHRPRFEHDCDTCAFIGQLVDHDIWVCPQGGIMPTVIARWGSDGPEYESGQDLSHLYAVQLTPSIEPRHLQQAWLQLHAAAFAAAGKAHLQMEDTAVTRERLAANALAHVHALYAQGYVDERLTIEDARQRISSTLVSH